MTAATPSAPIGSHPVSRARSSFWCATGRRRRRAGCCRGGPRDCICPTAGRAQAERVAERLAGLPVDAVYSSPLERACETAEPTAARTGLDVKHDDGLLECDFGEWTGAALADLAALPEWQTVQHSPSTFRFPNGESFTEMQARIVGALEALRTAHAGGVVVCFSHADPIKAAVAHALGTPLDLFQRIVISPGSVSAISFVEGQAPAVLMVNSTSEPLSGLRGP